MQMQANKTTLLSLNVYHFSNWTFTQLDFDKLIFYFKSYLPERGCLFEPWEGDRDIVNKLQVVLQKPWPNDLSVDHQYQLEVLSGVNLNPQKVELS